MCCTEVGRGGHPRGCFCNPQEHGGRSDTLELDIVFGNYAISLSHRFELANQFGQASLRWRNGAGEEAWIEMEHNSVVLRVRDCDHPVIVWSFAEVGNPGGEQATFLTLKGFQLETPAGGRARESGPRLKLDDPIEVEEMRNIMGVRWASQEEMDILHKQFYESKHGAPYWPLEESKQPAPKYSSAYELFDALREASAAEREQMAADDFPRYAKLTLVAHVEDERGGADLGARDARQVRGPLRLLERRR